MKKAKCIKGFSVESCDDDGFTIENSYLTIEENTIWDIEEDNFRVVGGDIRLTSDGLGWLEISQETFKEYFKPIPS